MIRRNRALLGALLCTALPLSLPATATEAPSWWEASPWNDPERGFLWYPDPRPPKTRQPAPEAPPAAPQTPVWRDLDRLTTTQEVHEEWKRRHDHAVMFPTPDNVRRELEARVFIMGKGAMFADVARRVIWQTPEFDYNVTSPRSNAALVNRNLREWAGEKRLLAQIGQDHGLLFFFRSDCIYCHEQAPVLKLLASRYGLPVLAISLDGSTLPEFPDARPDNGIGARVSGGRGISATPAMFLVSRRTQEAVPIAFGITALEDIVERVRVLTQTRPGEQF